MSWLKNPFNLESWRCQPCMISSSSWQCDSFSKVSWVVKLLILKPHVVQWVQKFNVFCWVPSKDMSAQAIFIQRNVDSVNCFWQKDQTNFGPPKFFPTAILTLSRRSQSGRVFTQMKTSYWLLKCILAGAFVNNAFTAQED